MIQTSDILSKEFQILIDFNYNKNEVNVSCWVLWHLSLKRLLSQSSFIAWGTRVECLLSYFFLNRIFLCGWVWLYKTFVLVHILSKQRRVICLVEDMPRGFSHRFIRHGLLLCTSAIGTGFLGQYLLEVYWFSSISAKLHLKNVNVLEK